MCLHPKASGADVPVVFFTARDATEDKAASLTVGGDDYVTKPFSLDELIARIRAVLRRTRPEPSPGRLAFADLELDEDTHEIWRQGSPIQRTATEFKLLRYWSATPCATSLAGRGRRGWPEVGHRAPRRSCPTTCRTGWSGSPPSRRATAGSIPGAGRPVAGGDLVVAVAVPLSLSLSLSLSAGCSRPLPDH